MRIAAIWIPQFPLQALLWRTPERRGQSLAVFAVNSALHAVTGAHGPVVATGVSRAARSAGAKVGMTVAQLAAVPGVAIERVGQEMLDAFLMSLADVVASTAPRIDVGRAAAGMTSLFAEVPARCRGATYGQRVVRLLSELGVHARVGIADDRFCAWAAAVHGTSDDDQVKSVPRGGSAQFLAPLPLSLLAIPTEVGHMLSALGVRTLGEFAALPPPSVARAWDADYQLLARGEGGDGQFAFASRGGLRERLEVAAESLDVSLSTLARRVAARLDGRVGNANGSLEVTYADGDVVQQRLELGVHSQAAIADALVQAMAGHPVMGLRSVQVELVLVSADAVNSFAAAGSDGARRAETINAATNVLKFPSLTSQPEPQHDAAGAEQRPGLDRQDSAIVAGAAELATGSGPVSAPSFVLSLPTPKPRERGLAPRRTQRGKRRSRTTMAGQFRLFSDG